MGSHEPSLVYNSDIIGSHEQRFFSTQRHEMEFQRDLVQRQRELSATETERLLATHKEEMEALRQNLKAEEKQQKKVRLH